MIIESLKMEDVMSDKLIPLGHICDIVSQKTYNPLGQEVSIFALNHQQNDAQLAFQTLFGLPENALPTILKSDSIQM